MPTQTLEPSLTLEAVLLQLSQTTSFIHAVALLVLSNPIGESLSDIADRVCARHLGSSMKISA